MSTRAMVGVQDDRTIRVVQDLEAAGVEDTDNLALSSSYLPHNQLLEVAVRYGFAGAALVVVFHVCVGVSLWAAVRSIRTTTSATSVFLVAATTGGLVSHCLTGLLHPSNIFTGRWELAFVFGCAVAVRSLVARPAV